jgi:hypothetical protein
VIVWAWTGGEAKATLGLRKVVMVSTLGIAGFYPP